MFEEYADDSGLLPTLALRIACGDKRKRLSGFCQHDEAGLSVKPTLTILNKSS